MEHEIGRKDRMRQMRAHLCTEVQTTIVLSLCYKLIAIDRKMKAWRFMYPQGLNLS